MQPKKLTKSQRRRRNERGRRLADKKWKEQMGEMPAYLLAFGHENTQPVSEPNDDWAKMKQAPVHLLAVDEETGSYCWDKDAIAKQNAVAGTGKSKKLSEVIAELREKYPNHWGKRGGAKHIALSETEEDPQSPLSERTVQRYIRLTKRIS